MAVRAPDFEAVTWIDTVPQRLKALHGRIVLLDFFTFGCINCMNNLPMLRRLYTQYGGVLQIIGVHGGKFGYEKRTEAVAAALERLGIPYPVCNDAEGSMLERYAIKAWPTMILIDAHGYIVATFRGEAQGVAIVLALKKLGLQSRKEQDEMPVPRTRSVFESVCGSETSLFVADSAASEVREYDYAGGLKRRFGPFALPSAVTWYAGWLYVCDREGGSVCRIVPEHGTREVLLTHLRAPSDLWIDTAGMIVAEAGAHTITAYGADGEVRWRVGNRFEALRDGEGEAAQLAQPMGVTRCDDGSYWFVDAESSALRSIADGRVNTLVGEGLFTFGDSDTAPILLQHPQGLTCGRIGDGCGGGRIFVADTYNGKLKAFDPLGGTMMTLAEGLHEPVDLHKRGCLIYIVEPKRLLRFDLSKMELKVLIGACA